MAAVQVNDISPRAAEVCARLPEGSEAGLCSCKVVLGHRVKVAVSFCRLSDA